MRSVLGEEISQRCEIFGRDDRVRMMRPKEDRAPLDSEFIERQRFDRVGVGLRWVRDERVSESDYLCRNQP